MVGEVSFGLLFIRFHMALVSLPFVQVTMLSMYSFLRLAIRLVVKFLCFLYSVQSLFFFRLSLFLYYSVLLCLAMGEGF